MNKGALVRRIKHSGFTHPYGLTDCDRVRAKGFTAGQTYRIKAGRGDATVGSKGDLNGAFILSETQMVLTDDLGYNRHVSFDTRFWEMVEDCENLNPIRKPVEVYCPRAGV